MAIRLTALAGLLAACLAGHAAARIAGLRGGWAPRFLGTAARLAGVRIRVDGAPAPRPLLLLANHISWLDILALGGGAARSAFVAHEGLAAHPLLRWLCRLNATLFVARGDRGQVARQATELREALARGGVMTLFAEGTTGDGSALLPFKSALLAAIEQAPDTVAVQPVLLDYGRDAAAIAWSGDEPGLANFTRILGRAQPIDLTIRFLPPLSADERVSRKAMAAAAQSRIAAALEATIDDPIKA